MNTSISLDDYQKAVRTLADDALIPEVNRLRNSLEHLDRSIQEMLAFNDQDSDFLEAIEENKELMIKQKDRLQVIHKVMLERQLPREIIDHVFPKPENTSDNAMQVDTPSTQNEEEGLLL
ncbi:hypothetical protein K493DRAFT_314672 [Basidiobolus meristosporus CBS 931.73]|uniref:Uncharacterized protein n=1 Tax=Basidiobolus meristosporus CBS 931.73 TaxID=1314790 RepID=A0A1Y1YDS5_9FUNG|nr:hypothetical protein K493DRAFT_314672 [Basidiobolus meristosporus CBS 931.73]|eukprot:ORX96095.1 hypothetical protein K493DRAFT_314672 [Basidiobolus meristosporus CBS 931.73]